MKIKVCIPFYSEFEDAKSGLLELERAEEHRFDIQPVQSTYPKSLGRNILISPSIADLRNAGIGDIEPENFDGFLFVDSDISFRKEDALKIINSGKDIIGGVYESSQRPGFLECGFFKKPGIINERVPLKNNYGIKRIDFTGFGFVYVSKKVFEKLKFPWFRHLIIDRKNFEQEIGEDLTFCILAQRAGFKIYSDFSVKVKHRLKNQSDYDWSLTNQSQRSCKMENKLKLEITKREVGVILGSLQEMPFKISAPVIKTINDQLSAQIKPVVDAPAEEPTPDTA